MKDLMIEQQNARFDELLASEIGLTREELESVDYELDDLTNSDGLLYGYQLTFPENTPKEIISKIAGIRDNVIFIDLNVFEQADDYYEDQLDALSTTTEQYLNFEIELTNLQELLKINTSSIALQGILLRQIYISAFGVLETYLSDTFIWLVRNDSSYLRAFVETYPEFRQRKFDLKDVFNSYDNIRDTASKVMLDIIYHDFRKVREMYVKTFRIEFPSIKEMMNYLSIRHDLVHRNGKNKAGTAVGVTDELVHSLISEIRIFVGKISSQLAKEKEQTELPF